MATSVTFIRLKSKTFAEITIIVAVPSNGKEVEIRAHADKIGTAIPPT